jgi:hypothetical protein
MTVYKYLPPHLVDSIIGKRLLRFTQPIEFNDPFECSPYITEYADGSQQKKIILQAAKDISAENINLPRHARRKIEKITKKVVRQKIRAHERNPDVVQLLNQKSFLERLSDSFGILTLSADPKNILMWGHYAEKHTGICVGFESTHSFFTGPSEEVFRIRHVDYENERHKTTLGSAEGDDLKIFFRKSSVWFYENEYRVIRPLKLATTQKPPPRPNGRPIYLFEFPADALTEVLFGVRTDETTKAVVRAHLKSEPKFSHVRQVSLEPDTHVFRFKH